MSQPVLAAGAGVALAPMQDPGVSPDRVNVNGGGHGGALLLRIPAA